MITKNQLKEFAEIVHKNTKDKKRTIEIIRFAESYPGRIDKMMAFYNDKPEATFAETQFRMSEIAMEETLAEQHN